MVAQNFTVLARAAESRGRLILDDPQILEIGLSGVLFHRKHGTVDSWVRRGNSMLLQIDKRQIDPDITVLEFTGKISLGRESQRIETMVNELLSQKVSKLIFDLSRVDYIDSAGLGIMTYCYGAMK